MKTEHQKKARKVVFIYVLVLKRSTGAVPF